MSTASALILLVLVALAAVGVPLMFGAWGRASKRRQQQPALRPVTHQEVQAALRGDEFDDIADPAWARAWRDDPTAPKEKR